MQDDRRVKPGSILSSYANIQSEPGYHCQPRNFRRDYVLACLYSVPTIVTSGCKKLYTKPSDPSRLSERLLSTNGGEKSDLRFPMYYSMNLKKNVEYICTRYGLELRYLAPSEVPYWEQTGRTCAFHMRLSPTSSKQGICMPLLNIGNSLDLTELKTGDSRKLQVDNYDAAPMSDFAASSGCSKHGILWGTWICTIN